jgi:hypothetical protein
MDAFTSIIIALTLSLSAVSGCSGADEDKLFHYSHYGSLAAETESGYITRVCPHPAIEAGAPYSLLVRFQRPGWGIEVSNHCEVKVDGKTIDLKILYQRPTHMPDSGLYEQETHCQLPALETGDYRLNSDAHCGHQPVIQIGDRTTGSPTCEKPCEYP